MSDVNNEESTIDQPASNAAPTSAVASATRPSEVLLEVTDLEKHFPVTRGIFIRRKVGAVKAVDGLTFSVNKGETLGVVGETGCGKSTAGRMLSRLLEPTGGSIKYDGTDITHWGSRKMRPLRREIQMIFQDPYSSLNPRHTIGTIISAPL
jgi:ABC-type microcin C transport system duplicated ATPase subunit YejF